MPEDPDAGIVIEVKYAKEMKELDAACEVAITQIKDKRYDEALRDLSLIHIYFNILCAFFFIAWKNSNNVTRTF